MKNYPAVQSINVRKRERDIICVPRHRNLLELQHGGRAFNSVINFLFIVTSNKLSRTIGGPVYGGDGI